MDSREREALYHLVLSSMEQLMDRDEFDAWIEGEIDIAPLLKPILESVASQRNTLIRELHQMFPAEVLDRFIAKRPDAYLGDKTQAIVRIGRELQMMKDIVQSL